MVIKSIVIAVVFSVGVCYSTTSQSSKYDDLLNLWCSSDSDSDDSDVNIDVIRAKLKKLIQDNEVILNAQAKRSRVVVQAEQPEPSQFKPSKQPTKLSSWQSKLSSWQEKQSKIKKLIRDKAAILNAQAKSSVVVVQQAKQSKQQLLKQSKQFKQPKYRYLKQPQAKKSK